METASTPSLSEAFDSKGRSYRPTKYQREVFLKMKEIDICS